MKPILVISHAACERAGYLCEYLGQRNISYERIRHEQGECIEQQGFVFKNCLAVQFHPEITKSMIHEWIDRYAHCLEKPALCTQRSDARLRIGCLTGG